jgi:hypothetical protein
MRQFDTGATRDDDQDKFDYEGFISPVVLERFAAYMHKHREQADGKLRDSDNWQKGIPISQYMKSFIRHTIDLWKAWRKADVDAMEELACAVMFNIQGLLFELLRPYESMVYDAPSKVDGDPHTWDNDYPAWPTQGDFERSGIDPKGGDPVDEGWQPKRTRLG